MDFYRKIERSVTISADKRSTVDLQVDIWSQDLNVTKFVLKLDTADSTPIDLTNAAVRVAIVYNQDGQDVKIEAAGIVEDVATQKIAYVMSDKLAGFEGEVTAGFYVTLKTGQRIDVQNVTFNMCKSLLDKDLEAATENYYQTFDDIAKDVRNQADTQKSAMLAKTNEVKAYGENQKTQIGQVLPDVQSKVSAINTELAKIDGNMPDLFVAYADDLSGGGFSKSDNSKLFKGYSVKNSTSPADYRWGGNVDRLDNDIKSQKTIGSNLIPNGYGEFGNNTNFNNFTFDGGNRYNNNPIFKGNLKGTYSIYDRKFLIDVNKSYQFSMNLKSDNGGRIYLGWVEYDIDGFNIAAKHSMGFSQTTTALARDLNDGDTVVYLESTANWVNSSLTHQNGLIFWNYRDSTGYLYPEGVYSRNVWLDLYTKENVNKTNNTITLKSPWNHGKITAGTKVSQSNDSGYKYRNFVNASVPTSWTHTSFKIGEDHSLQTPYNYDVTRFNPATKLISFVGMWSYNDNISDTYYINTVEFKDNDTELLLLDSNPINSVLTTLSSENPSTTLGGKWTQLGTESKFGSTIYYWKRTN